MPERFFFAFPKTNESPLHAQEPNHSKGLRRAVRRTSPSAKRTLNFPFSILNLLDGIALAHARASASRVLCRSYNSTNSQNSMNSRDYNRCPYFVRASATRTSAVRATKRGSKPKTQNQSPKPQAQEPMTKDK